MPAGSAESHAHTPLGLLAERYGYGATTSFVWPLAERWVLAHLQRLQQAAVLLGWQSPPTLEALREVLEPYLVLEQPPQVVRMQLYPNATTLEGLWQPLTTGRVVVSVETLPPKAGQPLKLLTVPYYRPFPQLKLIGGFAEAFLLKRQAIGQGADDALWVNSRGHLTESTTSNVFLIQDNTLITPQPQGDGCLPGVASAQVIEAAQQLGLPVVERSILPSELPAMAGAFLTNSIRGMQPVASVDSSVFLWPATAKTLLQQLEAGFEKIIQA